MKESLSGEIRADNRQSHRLYKWTLHLREKQRYCIFSEVFLYRLFLYDRRQLGSDNQSEWSARPRHKGYNRSCTLRQSLRQFDLRYLPQPNPNFRPKSHNQSRPLVTLISTNHPPHRGAYRATKQVTNFDTCPKRLNSTLLPTLLAD